MLHPTNQMENVGYPSRKYHESVATCTFLYMGCIGHIGKYLREQSATHPTFTTSCFPEVKPKNEQPTNRISPPGAPGFTFIVQDEFHGIMLQHAPLLQDLCGFCKFGHTGIFFWLAQRRRGVREKLNNFTK